MAAEAIKIRATAAKLFKETGDSTIEGYKTMPLDELRTHIERIQKGGSAAPAKGKTAPASNGTTRQKGKTVGGATREAQHMAATRHKGKGATATSSASTSAPAKSTARKSSPAKGKAETGTAKRPTTAAVKGKGSTATKGTTKPVKGRTSPAKPASTKAPARKPAGRGKAQVQGRVDIDNKAVDWKADWNGGKTGKRKDVMDALRKFKGDKLKVYNLLADKARTYYKGRSKDEAERMLVWLIGRVAYDFVSATAQHESGTRVAYGTADDNKNVRRRELRAERNAEAAKAERARKRAAKTTTGKGKGK